MKRFLPIAAACLLMLASVECNQHRETNELTETTEQEEATYEHLGGHSYDFLDFTSLEDLIENYKAVKEGKVADAVAKKAEDAMFAELEKLYAPTVIPEGYHLYKIVVREYVVRFVYLLESHMVSSDGIWKVINNRQLFSFSFYRQDTMDKTLAENNATEEDLIDGKYLFVEPNTLCWELNGAFFEVDMPLPLLDKLPDEQHKIEEMIKYAEVKEVDLGG